MTHEPSSLRDYLLVLRRRKWLLLLSIVVVPAVAVALSLRQKPEYQASAEVLLSRQNLAALLNNLPDQTLSGDPTRLAETQADLARVPEVARRALALGHITNLAPGELLSRSSVSAKGNADLLEFNVRDRNARVAALLATLYARGYIRYRATLDTAALARARSGLLTRIHALEATGDTGSALYASLIDKEQQLATMQALQTSNASLVKPAGGAQKTQPRPARNGAVGLFLGLMLGLALVFLRDALDTRFRTAEGVARRLGLPILAEIPAPPRSLRGSDRLAMLDGPDTIYAEPFRILRTSLELIDPDHPPRSVMVTSAIAGEGKSTTVANLAVAMARTGREVILVDLDFRHPYLGTFFPDAGRLGITDVAIGRVALGEALVPVLHGAANQSPLKGVGGSNGSGGRHSTLRVLGAGTLPPNPGEFVGSQALEHVLAELRARADLVLIDAAPMLGIGDTLVLASKVEALVLVTRLNHLRRPMITELERALSRTQAKPLGVVITGASASDTYGYDYMYAYTEAGDSGEPLPETRPTERQS